MAVFPYKGQMPDVAEDAFIAPTASVVGDVKVGAGTNIWFGSVVRGDVNSVVIGKHTNVQDNATIHTMSDAPTIIGDHVTIGHNAVVHCSKVGSNCLIGMGSVLIGYSEIGDNCVIGADTFIAQHKKNPFRLSGLWQSCQNYPGAAGGRAGSIEGFHRELLSLGADLCQGAGRIRCQGKG